MSKPLILVTNDDGITAPGIRALVEVAQELGEVVVIAPDSPQSGKSNSVTIHDPLRLSPSNVFPGIEAYTCSGTPVDCVKIGKFVALKGRDIALCVSGINHGSNAAINILYSGTMSAAMESAIDDVDAIGFSLLDYSHDADFEASKVYAKKIISYVLENKMSGGRLLNVNIPNLKKEEIKGMKVCRQAKSRWSENFIEKIDPSGKKYYWMTGTFEVYDTGDDTDAKALDDGYVSIVPSMFDLTDYPSISKMKGLEQFS